MIPTLTAGSAEHGAPRLDLAELVEGLASQPELFESNGALLSADDRSLLSESRSMARDKSGAGRFSGRNTGRDERRALTIAALVMMGESKREISRRVGCDKRVIAPVVRDLEAAGILPPLQDRVRRCEAELREQTLVWLDEMIDSRAVSRDAAAMLRGLFTGAGILADKQQAINGLGGGGISVQIGVNVAADPGNWRAQVAAVAGAPEIESGAGRCAAMVCDVSAGSVAGLEAVPVVEVGQVIAAERAGSGRPEEAGGGVALPAGGPRVDASGPEIYPDRGPEVSGA
jgi:hypothetical protein